MLKVFNIFTFNLAKPYVNLTLKIICNPSEIAYRIKRSQHLELSPLTYVRQGVVCIIAIWLLGYLLLNKLDSAPSFIFNIVIGIYFIINIICFTVILWILNIGSKPLSFTVILKLYSYIVGAFAPIAIATIELARILYINLYKMTDTKHIENIIMILFGIIGITYLYKFIRIVQEIRIVRFILAFIIYLLFS